jgi:pyruvate dehydrogenase E2 component (dihydrolipoamide acetyltransferase)
VPIEIKMPALSPTMEEGTLEKWLVNAGDSVKPGDILAEIQTDKVIVEFEAVDAGTIGELIVAAGTQAVKVGTTLALLMEDNEATGTVAEDINGADTRAPKAEATTSKGSQPILGAPEPKPEGTAESQAMPSGRSDRIKASPLARRLANEHGVDLVAIKGSGPAGRIVKTDLIGANMSASTPVPKGAPATAIKLSNIRKTIARRLTESKHQVPHIYLTVDVRLDALLKLRSDVNSGLEKRGIKLSVNDMLIKALALALKQVPSCNVQFNGDTLLQFTRADISVAVSIPDGLITPVITSADLKSLSAIALETKDLTARAREGKLQPHEYQGGTATLSNMGMYGIREFAAIINPPQAIILAIGAGEKRPYIVNDVIEIASVMSATGSFDHRAVDGADGAAFMRAFKYLVENPSHMLV